MSKLSGSATTDTHATESRVVFDKPKLQILPKVRAISYRSLKTCVDISVRLRSPPGAFSTFVNREIRRHSSFPILSDGGFAFFGGLLQWCDPPSQNALLICPTRHYTPNSAPVESKGPHSSWSKATEWASLPSQRREIFDADGDQLVYAGTFLVHAGPKVLQLEDLPQPVNEALLRELACRTFDPASKSQKTKAKAYLRALAQLYTEGAITVQVLGLQRVGFNDKFFSILRKAYGKRSKGRARSETQRSASSADLQWLDDYLGDGTAVASAKRAREEEPEPEAGPSKVRRLDEFLSDGWF
ncbi:hypothetical protein TRAPUB_7910 [Trametes pubescens]|uniref:Uncharacterized protein n=1 Tax=Trametes pubescens TaxID=154538 RepID=A0A1M2V237_TRAPU|nr:hypothetical protein TRAPUB_7910 [Trametes pubescens]